jgi:hypothetical protein
MEITRRVRIRNPGRNDEKLPDSRAASQVASAL